MCIAIPGEIIELKNTCAKVSIMGAETVVNIQLIDRPKIGDFVLIHAGFAIEKVDKSFSENYYEMLTPLRDLKEADEVKHG